MDTTTLRVSDADRDAVITELGQHFQAGRLDPAELDDRTGRALRARVGGDLDELLADLPRAQRPAGPPQPVPRPRPARAAFAIPVLIVGALITVALVAGGRGAGHHPWAFGWALWWVVPVLAMRAMWWRRIGGTRPWR